MKTMNRNSQETKYGEHPTLHVSRETNQNKNVNKNKENVSEQMVDHSSKIVNRPNLAWFPVLTLIYAWWGGCRVAIFYPGVLSTCVARNNQKMEKKTLRLVLISLNGKNNSAKTYYFNKCKCTIVSSILPIFLSKVVAFFAHSLFSKICSLPSLPYAAFSEDPSKTCSIVIFN